MNEIEQIKLLGKGLLAARQLIDDHKAKGDQLKEKKEEIQKKLLDLMVKSERDSMKFGAYKVIVATKKDIEIIDNMALIDWIEKEGKDDIFMPRKIDFLLVKGYAKKILKEDGEILAGTKPIKITYLSIRTNK